MKIKRIYARDFMSFEDIDLSFGEFSGLTLIEGWNYDDNSASGAGKTALMDIISYVPFGESPRGLKVGEFISDNATKGCVAGIEFQMDNGSKLLIERSRKPEDLFYQIDNQPPKRGGNVSETEKLIEDLLKLDFNTFTNSVYFTQNAKMNFISASDTEKRDILTRILDLAEFDKAYNLADEEMGEIETQQKALKTEHEKIQSLRLMCEKDVANLKVQLNQFDEETNKLVQVKNDNIKQFERKISDTRLIIKGLEERKFEPLVFERAQVDVESYDNKIAELRQIKPDDLGPTPLRPELADLDAKENELNSKLQIKDIILNKQKDFEKKKAELDLEFRTLDNTIYKINTTGEGKCPHCFQIVTAEHLKSEKERLVDELGDVVGSQDANDENLAKVNEALKKLKEYETQLKDIEMEKSKRERVYMRDLKDYSERSALLSQHKLNIEKQIGEIERNKQQALRDYAQEEKLYAEKNRTLELEKAENANRIQAQRDVIVSYENQIKQFRADISDIKSRTNPFMASIRAKVDDIAELDIKLEHSLNQLGELDKKHEVLAILKASYKNVKYYVFESTIDELNVRMVKYLDDLFIEDVKINFKFISGKTSDKLKFETKIVKNGIDKSYESLSDGEKGRAKLATNFALSDIVAMRKSNSFSLMLLDEVFNGLPEECRERVVALLETLKSEKESILIIDHFKAVGTLIEKTIHVEKKNGISRVLDAET